MPSADDRAPDAQAVQDALRAMVLTIMRPLVTRPRAKFLCEAVSGIVRQRTLVQRDIARALHETNKAPGTVERRLVHHINAAELPDAINTGLLQYAAPRIHVYTPIAIDLTDTQRPYARRTPGAEANFDGSTGKPGWGYTHLGATAVLSTADGVTMLPLYQDTYALEHATAAQTDDALEIDSSFVHYERAVRALHDALGGPVGIDVLDRGMDSRRCFGCELHYHRWFLIRLCDRRRMVRLADIPTALYPADVPRHVNNWHTVFCRVFNKRTRKWRLRACRIAWCTVHVAVEFPDGSVSEVPLTLLLVHRNGRTMFLLTNLTMDDADDPVAFAKMLYEAYLARWSVERCFDLLKNRIAVERIYARTLAAAKSLFALAWLTVACILAAFPAGAALTKTVISYVTALYRMRPAHHVFYTVFTALTRIWSLMAVVCSLH